MNPDDHLDVASGAIVPSICGEMAFRVIKKVCSSVLNFFFRCIYFK